MMDFERFEVVTALFPFIDMPQRKPRPVLILSAAEFNSRNGHIIGTMITTGAGSHWPSDHVILDLESAGLTHRSVIRWKVFTIPFSEIGRRIGRLSEADRSTFHRACETILPGTRP